MSAEYAFDLYPRDDPRDGTRLVRFTYEDLIAAEYRDVIGVGAGQATVWVDHAGVDNVDVRGEQYIRVVRLGGTEKVIGGIWTSKLPFETAVASERRHLTLSGPGQMAYLARARMAPHSYLDETAVGVPGQDPFDGMIRFSLQGAAAGGTFLGSILWRALADFAGGFRSGATYTHVHSGADDFGEIVTDSHADDRTVSRIPDLVLGFDQFEDSNGNDWTLEAGEFSAQVGENALGVVQRLMQAGLSIWMDPDTFTLYAWEGRPATKLGRSTDRTGASWDADVVRFQSPTDGTTATGNILSETTRVVNAYLPQGPIWVGGNDVYHKEAGSTDALYEGFIHSTAENDDALAQIGAAQKGAREEAADVGQLRHRLGSDPANGAYLPGEHYLLDELVRVDTGSGEWDYTEDNYPVGAWRVSLPEGGAEWEAHAELGASYEEARAREFSVPPSNGHTHPPNPQLCLPGILGEEGTATVLFTRHWDYEGDGSGTLLSTSGDYGWADNVANTGGPLASWFGWNGSIYSQFPKTACTPGQIITLDGTIARRAEGLATGDSYLVRWYDSTSGGTEVGEVGTSVTLTTPPSNNYVAAVYSFAVTVPPGVAAFSIRLANQQRHDNVTVQLLQPGTATAGTLNDGHPELIGNGNRASRCGHKHHVIRSRAPNASDDITALFEVGTWWVDTSTGTAYLLLDSTEDAAEWMALAGASHLHTAEDTEYDNQDSGLAAENVKAAIDELATHPVDTSDAHDASAISYDNTSSGMTATDVQAAIDELEAAGGGTAQVVGLSFRLGDDTNVLATGLHTYSDLVIPISGTITRWDLIANESGSVVIDVWRDARANHPPLVGDSITGSAKPTLSSAIQNGSATLTGWTTAVTALDVFRVNVDSAATLTGCTLMLTVERS